MRQIFRNEKGERHEIEVTYVPSQSRVYLRVPFPASLVEAQVLRDLLVHVLGPARKLPVNADEDFLDKEIWRG